MCFLPAPQATLVHSVENSLTNPMLMIAFFNAMVDQEPDNEVWSLRTGKHPVEFEPANFLFQFKRLPPLQNYFLP